MKYLLQEEMSRNLSWAGDRKYRLAIKISEAAVFLTAGMYEFKCYFYGYGMDLNIPYVFSIMILILVAFCRILMCTNCLFALKVWTAYVMKVHLPIAFKIMSYAVLIYTPLVMNNSDIFNSTVWLIISAIDFNIRFISKRNLRITPRN